MAEHRAGGMMGTDPQIDGMMHQMMDGMMQQMPDDANNRMPTRGRSRGQSPAAQATAP